ncbi:ABC transporter ATP-binding protein [Tengunoibacter tsumagoiensis]|uniref:Helicase n=1 Tax=Tengunoibacter tsumagoiensis TaxID=2014871 RepID=A0A402A8C5_9CHLR|nr:ABC transporter ATP-binding protein [Tengunoibacter tsumagoiensis]GCE15410.1 helicase [Tengunoibacter tsumagoiensis]
MQLSLPEYRRLLATYLIPQWRRVLLFALLFGTELALKLIGPQILRVFLDDATLADRHTSLIPIAVLFLVVTLGQQSMGVWAAYTSERIGWRATNALRIDLTRHLLQLDLSFYKEHLPGELIERIDGDVAMLGNFFAQFVLQVLGNLLLLVGILVITWFQEWHTGLALTLFALLAGMLINVVSQVTVPSWQAVRQANADLYGFLEERLGGTEDIRSSGAESYVMRHFFLHARRRFFTTLRARLISVLPWSVPQLCFAIGTVIAFLLAAWLYGAGMVSLGMAFLIYYYIQMLFLPMIIISEQLEDFQKARASVTRVYDLLHVRSRMKDGPGVVFPSCALPVEFVDVSFGYDDEVMVVHHLSFRLQAGEVLGVLGRTGSGKSTIARLLFRLYDPASGLIRLNGTDLRTAARADLRKTIGLVTQEVQLFEASVRDNLTFFDRTIDDARILAALTDLGMLRWYHHLPQGLDTRLAPNGGGLSAGEAQLLAFVRVFLKDPSVVILDEPSSRLDPATERLLEQAIDKLLYGRTAIIIAHRLSTVKRADSILILEEGRIREYGARINLARDPNSRFSHLLRTVHSEVQP